MIRFPGPGCVVEFIQGNRAQQAIVLEEQSGSLRLYTLSRREVRMPASRILPCSAPQTPFLKASKTCIPRWKQPACAVKPLAPK